MPKDILGSSSVTFMFNYRHPDYCSLGMLYYHQPGTLVSLLLVYRFSKLPGHSSLPLALCNNNLMTCSCGFKYRHYCLAARPSHINAFIFAYNSTTLCSPVMPIMLLMLPIILKLCSKIFVVHLQSVYCTEA